MIVKLNWDSIVELLLHARSELVLIMPAIHKEWIEVIKTNVNRDFVKLFVCVDNDEDVIRNGYGDISSLDDLKELNATLKECEGLRINFIFADDQYYALNLESRILSGNPSGYNAVLLPEAIGTEIKAQFFPEVFADEHYEDLDIIAEPIQEEKLKQVRNALKSNPPEEPDLKRKIATYSMLFQYAELQLHGGNISSKKISIPQNALPFKDGQLKKRMKTSFSLFDEHTTKEWTEIHDVNRKADEIRKKYLTPCSVRREKNILRKEHKAEFQREIAELKKLVNSTASKLIDKVQTAINNAEDRLRAEWDAFLIANPPESVKELGPENARRKIGKEIDLKLALINLPDAKDLVTNISLSVLYYDLTYEDLKDEEFLQWFRTKGLIGAQEEQQLATFTTAFEKKV